MKQHDDMDYDGMGNHGRFPSNKHEPKREKHRHNTTDLMLISMVIMFVVIWIAKY
jgi:hypothetical protein